MVRPKRYPRGVKVDGAEVPELERRIRRNRFTTPLDAVREAENRHDVPHRGRVPLQPGDGMDKSEKRRVRRTWRPWGS